MFIFLLVLVSVLLAYVAYLLNVIVNRFKRLDENVKSSLDELSRIVRNLELNLKQEREDFSESRIEELLRSGN
jgi:predicted PurR-regulated permease PerM